MSQQLVTNTDTNPTDLFSKVSDMLSTTANMSGMEYQLDVLSSLVISLLGDIQVNFPSGSLPNGKSFVFSSGTQVRLSDLNRFMQHSSVNFVNLDTTDDPMENWKIPYGIQQKSQVRDIQSWYLTTKIRLFGSINTPS